MNAFHPRLLALALCFACAAPLAARPAGESDGAGLTAQAQRLDRLVESRGGEQVTSRFATDFATFAGSVENAEALIQGLRSGTPITLAGTNATGSGGTATLITITPPTAPMGYGNAYVSLSLARAQLAAYGITEPTPEELQAALTGGSLTVSTVGADGSITTRTITLEGILTQRAAGMGWGEIAKANGFKLGPVVSAMKSAGQRLESPSVTAARGGRLAVETGAKAAHPAGHDSAGRAYGRGITTALGGGGVVYGKGHAKPTQVASAAGPRAAGVSQGHGGGLAKASGLASAAGTAPGHSGSAPGHTKAR